MTFRRWLAALAALVVAAGAAYQADVIRFVRGVFGPPAVTMQESYAAGENTATFDHSAYDELLARYVTSEGLVDYAGLRAAGQQTLDAYLESLAAAPFADLGRDEKLALLLNAYNAFTLSLIAERYPLESIMEIPEDQRWQAARWNLGGRVLSLDGIEHEEIRPRFREPRIHFALVCAALGCPKLRNEAYTGAKLDEQLAEQMRYAHGSPRWFRFDAERRVVEVSSLYDWYRGDFEQAHGSVLAAVAPYSAAVQSALAAGVSLEVRFIDYDWTLNDLALVDQRQR